jgi:hypothetical protein
MTLATTFLAGETKATAVVPTIETTSKPSSQYIFRPEDAAAGESSRRFKRAANSGEGGVRNGWRNSSFMRDLLPSRPELDDHATHDRSDVRLAQAREIRDRAIRHHGAVLEREEIAFAFGQIGGQSGQTSDVGTA